jgi:hypothetical protein
MDDKTLEGLVARLEDALGRVEAAARAVPAERWGDVIHTDYAAWTRRQLLAHMASNDLRQLVRVRMGAAVAMPEDAAELEAEQRVHEWNQTQVDRRHDEDIERLLDEMRANRSSLVGLLRGLTPDQRDRPMPYRGTLTPLPDMVDTIIRHLDLHAGELADFR